MKPRFARKTFLQRIEAAGHSLASLRPSDGIDLLLRFYREERAEGCAIDEDGDMLLFEWGCFDWGEGESFELKITRQFMGGGGEDEEIRQLSLTFKFSPSASLRNAGQGNRWCSTPDGLDEFRSFITASPATKAVAESQPIKVTLRYGVAG
jgi:hypothetical protein